MSVAAARRGRATASSPTPGSRSAASATKPWRARRAEAALIGAPADAAAFRRAAAAELEAAVAREHNAFKVELARRAIVRSAAQPLTEARA